MLIDGGRGLISRERFFFCRKKVVIPGFEPRQCKFRIPKFFCLRMLARLSGFMLVQNKVCPDGLQILAYGPKNWQTTAISGKMQEMVVF